MWNTIRSQAVVLLLAIIVGCGGSSAPPPTDFVATAEDFTCLKEQTRVRNLRIVNTLGYLDEAISLAENPEVGKEYPLGTILQLVPGEAMVKRGRDFDPANNNWEYFELVVSPAGTEIGVRGREEVINQFGGQCFGCHADARDFDFICEKDRGCVDIPLPQSLIDALQEGDPRCN